MLGIGLGIDYGLLMVNRFREERGHGLDAHDAVVATVASAGTTVLFSSLTVAVAMSRALRVRRADPHLVRHRRSRGRVAEHVRGGHVAARDARRRRRADLAGRARVRCRRPLLPADPLGAGPGGVGGRRRGAGARLARRSLPRRALRERRCPHAAALVGSAGHRARAVRTVPCPRHRSRHRHRGGRRERPRFRGVAGGCFVVRRRGRCVDSPGNPCGAHRRRLRPGRNIAGRAGNRARRTYSPRRTRLRHSGRRTGGRVVRRQGPTGRPAPIRRGAWSAWRRSSCCS